MYTPVDYNPVVSQFGGRSWRQHELSSYTSLGIDPDTAAELLCMRRSATGIRRSQFITKGLILGASRDELDMMWDVNPDGADSYIDGRRSGLSHNDALAAARDVHLHRFGPSELLSDFCPVLGTGTRTTRRTCVCGYEEYSSERRNYSGD